MGVGPDGACGGSSGGGESWADNTAATARASASETEARTLIMAAGWYQPSLALAKEGVSYARLRCLRQLAENRLFKLRVLWV